MCTYPLIAFSRFFWCGMFIHIQIFNFKSLSWNLFRFSNLTLKFKLLQSMQSLNREMLAQMTTYIMQLPEIQVCIVNLVVNWLGDFFIAGILSSSIRMLSSFKLLHLSSFVSTADGPIHPCIKLIMTCECFVD